MTWIKFSDKHPEENESVLVTDGERIGSAYIRYYGENNKHFHLIGAAHGGREWEWYWGQDENVTHWMPLPELPS